MHCSSPAAMQSKGTFFGFTWADWADLWRASVPNCHVIASAFADR